MKNTSKLFLSITTGAHNLDYLVQQCSAIDTDFKDLDMKNLSLYAVRARYPHDHFAPELSEATTYYQLAWSVKGLVVGKIIFT